jgi:DNA-binding transcriptional LysR family regulator
VSGFVPIESNDEGDFVLLPPLCPSREELERELAEPIQLPDPSPPRPPPPQFSLRDVMLLMVGVAAGLAGGSWMPAKLFAALLGLALLSGLLIVSWRPPETRLGKVIWASFVIAYFMAIAAAVIRPPTETLR